MHLIAAGLMETISVNAAERCHLHYKHFPDDILDAHSIPLAEIDPVLFRLTILIPLHIFAEYVQDPPSCKPVLSPAYS